MKKFVLITLAAIAATASIGCTPAANTTTSNVKTNANGTTAVVVNSSAVNTNGTGVSTMNSNTAMGNTAAMTRADFDRDKDRYAAEAKAAGSTVGTGLNDGWLLVKAKAALATVNDLRDSTINVDVNNEVVTLRGTVATKEQSAAAATAAKVDGVKSVTNNLKVSAGDSMANQMTGGAMTDGDKKAANSNK